MGQGYVVDSGGGDDENAEKEHGNLHYQQKTLRPNRLGLCT